MYIAKLISTIPKMYRKLAYGKVFLKAPSNEVARTRRKAPAIITLSCSPIGPYCHPVLIF
jgi:hypothetical protein